MPGSTVTGTPAASLPVLPREIIGASWISRPTPCPVPWPKCPAWPAAPIGALAAAQRAGLAAVTAGAEVAHAHAAARDPISAAGHAGHFGHGTGHGVGLEIHEAPMISRGRTGRLAAGVPVTVEPGIYLPGKGGVRIEDTLVVRAGPGAIPGELLTTVTRELLVL